MRVLATMSQYSSELPARGCDYRQEAEDLAQLTRSSDNVAGDPAESTVKVAPGQQHESSRHYTAYHAGGVENQACRDKNRPPGNQQFAPPDAGDNGRTESVL